MICIGDFFRHLYRAPLHPKRVHRIGPAVVVEKQNEMNWLGHRLARIEDPDVDAFCRELNDKKYKYARPGIQEMPWGAREMTLNDPFGNKLIFYKNV